MPTQVLIIVFFRLLFPFQEVFMTGPPTAGITEPEHRSSILYKELACPEISEEAFRLAMEGYGLIMQEHKLRRDTILTIIDFSKPSTENRIFVIDLKNKKLLEKTLVAHGKGSGELYAENFSNRPHSLQSSLGFYITRNTYTGKHGYSLRLEGIEPGINSNAMERAIVMHGAGYVCSDYIKKYGRIGRSFGCPALPYALNRHVIDLVKNASFLFIYYPDQKYRRTSMLISSVPGLISE